MLNRPTRLLFPTVLLISLVALMAEARPLDPKGQSPESATPTCPTGKVLVLGKCFDPCPAGTAHDSSGRCTLCVDGYTKNPKTGACVAPVTCPTGKVLVLDRCFDPCPAGTAHDSSGKCTLCADGYTKNPKTGACGLPL